MFSRIGPRLSYANVVSSVALFVVLGGGAYATIDRKVGTKDLRKGAVSAPKLKKKAVGTGKLKPRAVGTGKLKDGAVATPKLADAAVTGAKLADGAVETGKIANGHVRTADLAANAVNGAKVAANSLGGADIAESSLGLVPDADRLDGLDAGSLVRVAGDASDDLPNVAGDALTTQITAPRAGFLHIVGSVDVRNTSTGDPFVACRLQVDGPDVPGTSREVDLDGDRTTGPASAGTAHTHEVDNVNTRGDCATNAVHPVGAGAHTVDLHMLSVDAGTILFGGALNVLFVPFDGTGG